MSASVLPFPVRRAIWQPSGVFWEHCGRAFCGPCQVSQRKPGQNGWRRVRLADPAQAARLHCSRCFVWIAGSRELGDPWVTEANAWVRQEAV